MWSFIKLDLCDNMCLYFSISKFIFIIDIEKWTMVFCQLTNIFLCDTCNINSSNFNLELYDYQTK
jgi:hypothetical protein